MEPSLAQDKYEDKGHPSTKKIRTSTSKDESADEPEGSAICYLMHLPLELLAEILQDTCSPKDVLAVARCSKYFCTTLVESEASSNFIWRSVRATCKPEPIPDPTPNFTEASYAAFLFDGGVCEVCAPYA
jgi:hypothetical protein